MNITNKKVPLTVSLLVAALCNGVSAKQAPLSKLPSATPTHQTIDAPIDPLHNHSQRQLNLSSKQLSQVQKANCDTAGYATKTGQALVDHILTQASECINDLYTANATSFAAFQSANMVTVANGAAAMASTYSATNGPDTINNLYYFLRTGYYIQYYNSDNVPAYGSNVTNAVRQAIDNLVNNSDFYANSNQHGKNIRDAIILIDSAGENTRYIPMIKQWLTRWDQNYASSWDMRASVNGIFTILFRGHYLDSFKQATQNDVELIQKLGNFARQDWMLSTDALYLQENAAAEMARFLQYSNIGISSTLKQQVQLTLDRYDMTGTGKTVWLRIADQVDYWGRCSEYNICGFKEELEARVLPLTHTCSSTLKMRAEDITNAQFNESCNILSAQETFFHQMLQTNNTPVAGDKNTDLEMVIFNNSGSYKDHAGLFFGISTDNGGMYLEGDPTDVNNQARFIAYEAEWLLPEFHIWNLTHEYVHYLDGRFNLHGDFGASQTSTHKTVWWIEGLAEYISKKNRNDNAINAARTQKFPLSTIISNTYSSGTERIYTWGYLAVRFMFEKHPQDVIQLLELVRAGDYDGHLGMMQELGNSYDNEWNAWLLSVQSDDSIPTGLDGSDNGGSQALTNGEPRTGLQVATAGEDLNFYIDVPANATKLELKTFGGTGDVDLYVKRNAEPTDSSYDCRPYNGGNYETCTINNPVEGRWYVRLKAYSAFSNVSLTGSFTVSDDTGSEVELTNGVAQTGLSVANQGATLTFYIDVPENASDLNFDMLGGTGDADLYVSHGSIPSDNSYDCRPWKNGNTESCAFAEPQSGRWYVVVKAYNAFSGVNLTASYTESSAIENACDTSAAVESGNIEIGTATCIAGSNNNRYVYTYVPEGTTQLTIRTQHGSGNMDLYVRDTTWASTTEYDHYSNAADNTESIVVNNPASGWYYVTLAPNTEFGNTTLLITAE